MKKSAGIAIIYRNQILMSRPTNAPWFKSWMPPKGKIEEGETEEEAACREVEEECGIPVDPKLLGGNTRLSTLKDSPDYTRRSISLNAGWTP